MKIKELLISTKKKVQYQPITDMNNLQSAGGGWSKVGDVEA